MQGSLLLRRALVFLSVLSFLAMRPALLARQRGEPQQPQATFRARVTAVPIDVRVIDQSGRPVADLTQADFTIFEDDVRQPIAHFSRQVLTAQEPGPALRARADVPAFEAAPQKHRVFLIVLGTNALRTRSLPAVTAGGSVSEPPPWMAEPSKALDGLLHLVHDRLLPQDQVAVLASSRASDFTANHEAVAKLLEAFQQSEAAGTAALERERALATVTRPPESVVDVSAADMEQLGFAEYVEARNRRTSDLENVHYGIRYLRYMEGEKHLIYVTSQGMVQPSPGTLENQAWEDPKQLAAAASDARVALHVIQTGGIPSSTGNFQPAQPVMTPLIRVPGQAYWGTGNSGGVTAGGASGGSPQSSSPQPGWDRPPGDPPVPIPGMDARGIQALSDLRTLARLTGGLASIMSSTADAVDRIDAQTRVDYLLAYYPSNVSQDGRYRAIRVDVNRSGVTVLFRHGYYARENVPGIDRRSVVTQGRLTAAMTSTREIRDIGLYVTPTFTKAREGKGGQMLVTMTIDGARLGWTTDELSRRVARLEVGVFCGDSREKIVGQALRTLDITLTERRFAASKAIPYSVQVPLKASARFVKVIVYDYEANILGSKVVIVK